MTFDAVVLSQRLVFVVTIALIISGHFLGVLAWRGRVEGLDRWRWLVDPLYAFKASYYREPDTWLRRGAMLCLVLGAVGLVGLVFGFETPVGGGR